MAGDARSARGRFGRPRQPRRLCSGRLRQGLPIVVRLDRRRRYERGRPAFLPFSQGEGRGCADRRLQRPRHRAVHGQRLLSRGPVASAGRHSGGYGQAGTVPGYHDPSSPRAQRGVAAQAAVRHRAISAHREAARRGTRPAWAFPRPVALLDRRQGQSPGAGRRRCGRRAVGGRNALPGAMEPAGDFRRSGRLGAQADAPRPDRADDPRLPDSQADLLGEPAVLEAAAG